MSRATAQPYTVSRTLVDGVDLVQLANPCEAATVSIAPRIGHNAYEFLVNGKNAFWFPYASVGEFAAQPDLCGNPFLAPWANRLD